MFLPRTARAFGDASAACGILQAVLFAAVILVGSARANPPLPIIPTNIYYATNYGAVGDGLTTNTTAIQAAINAAGNGGGGTVEITAAAGSYLCGPITMLSSVNLQVNGGAMLQMLPYADWPGTTSFISGASLHDVEISGSGTIDGQGAAWWAAFNSGAITSRPNFIVFGGTTRILFQDITLQNPPNYHLFLKGNNVDITIQGITIDTPGDSPNTDGMDLGSTNVLVENCHISDGDDNIEMGGSTDPCAFVTITNCVFGTGHGVSVGSATEAGVSNVTVINCSFTGTENGIRCKSDNDRGGLVQNLSYLNITMTNVGLPIVIYSYYDEVGTPDSITAQDAAEEPVAAVLSTTPIWRDITISNLTVVAGSEIGGIIWGRTELPVTNITLANLNVTAPKSFDIYNASGVTISDSQFNLASGDTLTFYDAQTTITNPTPTDARLITLDGLTTNATSITLSLYNTLAALTNTNLLATVPALTTGGSSLTISNNLALVASSELNFVLGSNADTIAIKSNLTFAGTVEVTAGGGFGAGTYTLATYGRTLTWGATALGTTPPGYEYDLNTNTPGQINLVVIPPPPAAPTNLTTTVNNVLVNLSWSSVTNATAYNLKRALVTGGPYTNHIYDALPSTNYSDTVVTNGVEYFYVVTGTNAGGESQASAQAEAIPQPSLTPVSLGLSESGEQFQLDWPADHTGWRLEIQTNDAGAGISNNWSTYSGSVSTDQATVPISRTNGSVFLRLIYP
jgi:hypothetical protein